CTGGAPACDVNVAPTSHVQASSKEGTMKRLSGLLALAGVVVLGVTPAFAGSSTDAALGLGAFAVFNQILSGTGVFGAGRPVYREVVVAPAPVVVQPPPAVVYTPPPAVVYGPPQVVYAPAPPPPVYYVPAPAPVYAYPYAVYPYYRAHRSRHPHHDDD